MLGQASSQWSSRPADERFWTIADMHAACEQYRREAATARVEPASLKLEAAGDNVHLLGSTGATASLTNYSFGQLARLGGAPAGYLQGLPATLAADCANHALQKRARDDNSPLSLLFRRNGGVQLRAATSEKYTRIWNSLITAKLGELAEYGWKVPPAMPAPVSGVGTRIATTEDCGEYTLVQPGQSISPSGLYASDRDMFAFMIHPDRVVDAGGGRKLFRGFFVRNSEVGDMAFALQCFLFDFVCFNHNVWGAEQVTEMRVRHIGHAVDSMQYGFQVELRKYLDRAASEDELQIAQARRFIIAATPEAVIDKLFSIRTLGVPRKTLELAQARAIENSDAYGDPKSAWGMAQGLTEVSQGASYTSERVNLDRAAGRIVEMSF